MHCRFLELTTDPLFPYLYDFVSTLTYCSYCFVFTLDLIKGINYDIQSLSKYPTNEGSPRLRGKERKGGTDGSTVYTT